MNKYQLLVEKLSIDSADQPIVQSLKLPLPAMRGLKLATMPVRETVAPQIVSMVNGFISVIHDV